MPIKNEGDSGFISKLGPIPPEHFENEFAPMEKTPTPGEDPVFDDFRNYVKGVLEKPSPPSDQPK
jgi:hypothetical protein